MTPGPEVVRILDHEIEIGLNAVDALDRKLALVVPFLGTVAALLLPSRMQSSQVGWAVGAAIVGAIAVAVALSGLRGIEVEIGPEQGWLAEQTDVDSTLFYREVAARQKQSVTSVHKATKVKSERFNLALLLASVAMGLFLAVRLIPGS
jgi:hypothetical protein